tara:strand:+ start:477 stop:1940 length:1464 start_codon:yes stop_codon:yes gene_type:complete
MKQKKYFYERSNLLESKVNINFENLLWMDDSETNNWIYEMRNFILSQWDNEGIPPTIGQSENKIKLNFRKLRDYNIQQFLVSDDDGNENVIKNYNKFASGVNQFFPTMLKTVVGNSSIYDWFTDEYKDRFNKVIMRILKRDSMYNFSKCILKDEYKNGLEFINSTDEEWFIVQQTKVTNPEHLVLTTDEIKKLNIDSKRLTNVLEYDDDKYTYYIRRFELGQKIFPAGIQAFRLGLGQPAVNFPPLTARWIYENYTKHIPKEDTLNIYDPSSGWGGRILGAMASHRKIHYIGTDPNTDNFIDELNITRYEYVADFFNNKCLETNAFWEEDKNTHHIFQEGSEHIGNHKDFQKYKGKLDLVFTSPPYFDREQYSDDDEQSFKAYPQYEDWRDNFLKPTLENAFYSLRNDRYLLWNIADIKIGKDKFYPLEQDSIDILVNLGMDYQGKLKMLMTSMVGVNQENVKNSVKIDDKHYKYEPIFVFHKKKLV